jgi:hypothetical protein
MFSIIRAFLMKCDVVKLNILNSLFLLVISLLLNCSNNNHRADGNSNEKKENENRSKYEINILDACSFDIDIKNKKLYAFDSDTEAEDAVKKIMKLTGLPSNFIIKAANVPNASAVILCPTTSNCKRYILYNQEFLESIKDETKTDFSELAIICHEIGHHLSGHTLSENDNRQDNELEADKFAGFMLYKMGATIEETKSAFQGLPENGSNSHPPRSARLIAVSSGWYDAKRNGEQIEKSNHLIKIGEVEGMNRINQNKRLSEAIKELKRFAEYCSSKIGTPQYMELYDFGTFIFTNDLQKVQFEIVSVSNNMSGSVEMWPIEEVDFVIKTKPPYEAEYWTFDSYNKILGCYGGRTGPGYHKLTNNFYTQ